MKKISNNPAINLFEEGKWPLAVTGFDATNSVYNITRENNSFPISTPCYGTPKGGEETINKLNEILELRCQNDGVTC